MQGPNESSSPMGSGYNFIYNDGEWQIIDEYSKDDDAWGYYAVNRNYSQVAAFKDKKEALLWVGRKNKESESLKDSLRSKDPPSLVNTFNDKT